MPWMRGSSAPRSKQAYLSREEIEDKMVGLGKWFHNIDLNGVQTAPNHFLGDFPSVKWKRFAHVIPTDLRGKSVLDIGCNGGFYLLEMKKRGADRVVGIDNDPDYLAQARFAAKVSALDIEFRELSVYDIAALNERFDIVMFMGVLYHLRYPLLALDLIYEHVTNQLLVFQSMIRGGDELLGNVCQKLGVKPGGTAADGKITVEFAECIGVCEGAPAVLVTGRSLESFFRKYPYPGMAFWILPCWTYFSALLRTFCLLKPNNAIEVRAPEPGYRRKTR